MQPSEENITTFHGEIITIDEAIRRFEISPIIQRFGTWVVTTFGLECLSTYYAIEFHRVNETDWVEHLETKKWVVLEDFIRALHYARELQERRNLFSREGKPLKVFLCHAQEDKPFVRKMYNEFVAYGIEPWLDEKSILPGQDWTYEIKKAVKSSDVVIILLSDKSVDKTGYVQKEIRIALDAADERPEGKIFLIPAKIAECNIPDRLSSRQWVDLQSKDGFERLMQALHFCAQE